MTTIVALMDGWEIVHYHKPGRQVCYVLQKYGGAKKTRLKGREVRRLIKKKYIVPRAAGSLATTYCFDWLHG